MKQPILLGIALPVLVAAVTVALISPHTGAPMTATSSATPATSATVTGASELAGDSSSSTLPATSTAASSTAVGSAPAQTSTPTATTTTSTTGTASTPATATSTPATAAPDTTPRQVPASATAQYADQQRGVIDQSAPAAYVTDASYAIGTIPQDTPALAPGENVEVVQANCSVCHATTFISSQPPLPAATWHDEVYKMKEKYGATFISDENADKIIAYLSAHYTPETHQGVAKASSVAKP
ncbi:hypothetical protein Dxin01_03592 [Deinococcus xinjiangensis]|uniref:Cytochrome c n=1 Tax=Deinococcus xinjiangensis TaxID=457454 RepID=A0ABP9VF27_9DEIO